MDNVHHELLKTKKIYEDTWLTYEDIHAVSIGYKVVEGVKTDELAIVVHTADKKDREDVPQGEYIPPRINGIPTDVVEMPPFKPLPIELEEPLVPRGNSEKYRPVPGGVEIYMPRTPTNGGICTLGMYAQSIKPGDSSSDIYLLTNAHCLQVVDQIVRQPVSDLEENDIALSSRVLDNERIDGGIAKMNNYQTAEPFTILNIGTIKGVYQISIANLGERVIKSGRTTGITIGTIDYVFVSVIDKKDQIVIKGEAPFAEPGDSGSVVLMYEGEYENHVMGLLWGGVLNYAILSPIQAVVEELEIQLITDEIPIIPS